MDNMILQILIDLTSSLLVGVALIFLEYKFNEMFKKNYFGRWG